MESRSEQFKNDIFEISAEAVTLEVEFYRDWRHGTVDPNLLPVVNFYAGGTDASLYGGGIHRTIKEFMNGDEVKRW